MEWVGVTGGFPQGWVDGACNWAETVTPGPMEFFEALFLRMAGEGLQIDENFSSEFVDFLWDDEKPDVSLFKPAWSRERRACLGRSGGVYREERVFTGSTGFRRAIATRTFGLPDQTLRWDYWFEKVGQTGWSGFVHAGLAASFKDEAARTLFEETWRAVFGQPPVFGAPPARDEFEASLRLDRQDEERRPRSFALVGATGRYEVPVGTTTVGRKGCTICLDDKLVSGHHAVLFCDEACLWVMDWSSSNGVYVNDERVYSRQLASGDCLRMGDHRFEVTCRCEDGGREVDELFDAIFPGLYELYATDDAPAVARKAVATALWLLRGCRGRLWWGDDRSGTLEVASRGFEDAVNETWARPLRERVAREGTPVVVNGVERCAAEVLAVEHVTCLPLTHEGRVQGALYVDRSFDDPFGDADVALVQTLSASIAAALSRPELPSRSGEKTR